MPKYTAKVLVSVTASAEATTRDEAFENIARALPNLILGLRSATHSVEVIKGYAANIQEIKESSGDA